MTWTEEPRGETISGGIPTGALSEPERQRYLAQSRRMGKELERLRAENAIWMERAHNAEEALDRLYALANNIRAKQAERFKVAK